MDERELPMKADPKTYFFTEHCRAYPAMPVNLASARADQVQRLLEQSWRAVAPKKTLMARETGEAVKPAKRSGDGHRKS